MEHLIDLIEGNEDWLVKRILAYAKDRGYTKYTSTLEEAWRISVVGLSASLVSKIREYKDVPELKPGETFQDDDLTSFGVLEAKRHRERGIDLAMFLGLMKYYKQCYLDLVTGKSPQKENIESIERDRLFIERCFDRIEIAFCLEWVGTSENARLHELQDTNRRITNEKNAYLTVFESLADPIIILDKTNNIVNLNHEATRLFDPFAAPGASYYQQHQQTNYSPSLIGKNVLDIFPWLGRVMGEPESRPKERISEIRTVNHGKQKYFEVKYSRMLDVSEKFTAALLTVRDISVQKFSESELQESTKLWHALMAASFDTIFITTPEGKILAANNVLAKLLGCPHNEFIGKIVFNLIPGVAEQRRKKVAEVLQTKQPIRFEDKQEGGGIDETIYPVLDETGKVAKLVFISSDITQRIQAEKALRKAKEAAEAASSAKSQFLSTMSHEIRTPLNAVIGMTQVLSETSLNIEQQQFLRILSTAGEDLMALINDILDISKIETGHFELENIPFNLRQVVEKTCEILAVRAHKKKLELAAHVHSDASIRVSGDPYRLQQVLINLIGNAIKFTDEGQVVVEVRLNPLKPPVKTGPEERDFISILFTVTDTGIGIPLDKHESIFERFAQVDSSTTREYGGTGLGLAISNRLLEMMGGSIGVDSEVGKGSRFFFDILFEFLREEKQPEPCGKLDLKGKKILVADDNSTNRLIIKEMLSHCGADVREVENGKQAIEELKNALECAAPYQLLLLDRSMPGMDGFDVARHLKKNSRLTGTFVLMLTSDFDPGDIAQLKKLGVRRYLVKPVKHEELEQVINDVIKETAPVVKKTGAAAAAESLPVSRLLLVEDSKPNQIVVEAFLKGSPVQIDIAGNGSIGLEKYKKKSYHLILMDIQMPVMDGLTATREIRKWEKKNNRPHTPIIAMTAHALVDERQKSYDAGCDDHLVKPINRKNFLDLVGKYLGITDRGPGLQGQKQSPGLNIAGEEKQTVYVDHILEPYVPGFLKSLNRLIIDITECIEQQDFDNIQAMAHRIKGDSGTYGLDEVGRLGAALQITAQEKKGDEIRRYLAQLSDYLKRIDIRVERRDKKDEG